MATKLKTTKVKVSLSGHGLEAQGNLAHYPLVVGTFAEDPVTGNDGAAYAVLTVEEGDGNLSAWIGTYRLPLSGLKANRPDVFTSLE